MFLCSVEAIGPELLWVFVDSTQTRYVGPRWTRVLDEPEMRALLNDWWQSARELPNPLNDLSDRALAVD